MTNVYTYTRGVVKTKWLKGGTALTKKNPQLLKMLLSPSIRWLETWQIVSKSFGCDILYKPGFLYIGILRTVLEAAIDGAYVLDLCVMGDRLILEETSKVYKKEKEMKKGI